MINKGDCLKVKTKTLHDVFGTCFYEVVATGLMAPETGREKAMDGVKCVMLGGNGPSARQGFVVMDSQMHIAADIAAGVTEVVDKSQVGKLMKSVIRAGVGKVPGDGAPRPNIGCMEI